MFDALDSDNIKIIDFGLSSIAVPRNDLVH